jgi:hypothetical protein
MYRFHVVVLVSGFEVKTVQLPSSTVNPFKMAEVRTDQKSLFSKAAG